MTHPRPMTDDERRAAGFCTCPQIRLDGLPRRLLPEEPCQVHEDDPHTSEELRARGLLFLDHDRNRYVTWPDAAEALRQRPHLKRPGLQEIQVIGWIQLVRLLEALRDPLAKEPGEPLDPVTEEMGADLIAWADTSLSVVHRRTLLWIARSDAVDQVCGLFRVAAQNAGGDRP